MDSGSPHCRCISLIGEYEHQQKVELHHGLALFKKNIGYYSQWPSPFQIGPPHIKPSHGIHVYSLQAQGLGQPSPLLCQLDRGDVHEQAMGWFDRGISAPANIGVAPWTLVMKETQDTTFNGRHLLNWFNSYSTLVWYTRQLIRLSVWVRRLGQLGRAICAPASGVMA